MCNPAWVIGKAVTTRMPVRIPAGGLIDKVATVDGVVGNERHGTFAVKLDG